MAGSHVAQLEKDLYLVRVFDEKTQYFEGIWYIPEGVVYNSYVLLTSSGTVVFDTAKPTFREEYIDALKRVTDPRDTRYIVIHHMEPDHSGLVKHLVEISSASVLGHPIAGRMLRSFYGFTGRFHPVSDGNELSIGEHRVRFIHTPWLHWPETMMSYLTKHSALLTCDAFGAYGFFTKVFYDELRGEEARLYSRFALKYFANIIGPYRQWVAKNVEKVLSMELKPRYLLPSHGVVARNAHVEEFVDMYLKWSRGEPNTGKVTVIYTSMYGFVEKAVRSAVERLRERGLSVVVHAFDETGHCALSEVLADAYDSEVLVIATSTYDADAFPHAKYIVDLLARRTPIDKKRVVIAALYGWGPRAGTVLRDALSRIGVKDPLVLEYSVEDRDKLAEEIFKAISQLT